MNTCHHIRHKYWYTARSHNLSVPPESCSPVLGGLLCASIWRFQSSATAVSQSASAGYATTSSQQVRTPIVLRCSSDGLELVSRLPSGPDPTLSIDNFRSTLKTHLFVVQRDM